MDDMMAAILIKVHDPELPLPKAAHEGEWYDLRAAEDCRIFEEEFKMISLGVSMELPLFYEAIIAPRSSTFKTWGVIQTNGIGVIDYLYNGDNDIWKFPMFCLQGKTGKEGSRRYSDIKKGDRICQFRIQRQQYDLPFVQAEHLNNSERGGIGSTGTR